MSISPRVNIETIRLIINAPIHYFLFGAGICYTIESKKYLHIPLVILSPSAYAGYHCYKNKNNILEWLRK
jgi:hypothetical protein